MIGLEKQLEDDNVTTTGSLKYRLPRQIVDALTEDNLRGDLIQKLLYVANRGGVNISPSRLPVNLW
jgi:hypothetical protein